MLDVSVEVVITDFKNLYPICNQKWVAGDKVQFKGCTHMYNKFRSKFQTVFKLQLIEIQEPPLYIITEKRLCRL